ncbi:hypothetical protein WJX79_008838 [Trebouxia sp. C0005]
MPLPTLPLVSPGVEEDAWGDEADGPVGDPGGNTGASRPGIPVNSALRQRLLSSQQASVSREAGQGVTGPYSLQAYCLGYLGQYIEELLLCGAEVLPFLPPDAKASLLAIARRQGLLTDAALAMLVDSSWTSLDISESCVTDAGLQTALQTTPHLSSLDLTGCIVSLKTVRTLGSWCDQLQVLRIGCTNIHDDHVWAFPRILVNPQPGSCSSLADPAIALDEAAMQNVAPFWEQEQIQEPEQQEHLVPLSERFRLAYVSRAERIAAKAERNYQQRKRRELRNNTVLQALARFKFL